MVKLVVWFKRNPGLAIDAFQLEWLRDGVETIRAIPEVRGHVRSLVLESGYRKGEPFCDAIAETWFADAAAAARSTAELAAGSAGAMLTVEHLIKEGPKPPDGVKNVEFVIRRRDLDVEEFHRYWREHHGPLAARIAPIRRYVQSHAIDDAATRRFDGIASTWFDDTAAMRVSATTEEYRSTREDEANFIAGHLPFVITREHVLVAPKHA